LPCPHARTTHHYQAIKLLRQDDQEAFSALKHLGEYNMELNLIAKPTLPVMSNAFAAGKHG
jgi:hypothetical protein